jgi:hypothetical protein
MNMSEVEFKQLVDAVSAAVALRANEAFLQDDDFSQDTLDFDDVPSAANDNQIAWPMIPFPAGWYAAC